MSYRATIFRPTMCCKSMLNVGQVVTVEALEPADPGKWVCARCLAPVPAGEIMARLSIHHGVPKYRLANLPSRDAVERYDAAPVEGLKGTVDRDLTVTFK